MQRVHDRVIETHETEWGVRFSDGFIVICDDEDEARELRAVIGGEIGVREVYMTAWAEVDE